LSVSNANGTVGLFVSSTSNVGIGTTNTSDTLTVDGTMLSYGNVSVGAGANGVFGQPAVLFLSTRALSFGNSPTTPQTLMRLQWKEGSGDLGVGEGCSITFAQSLTADTAYYDGCKIASFKETSSDSTRNAALTFWTSTDGGFAAEPAERMRISGTGFVGIGTTNPQYSLQVVGTVASTGIAVSQPSALPLTSAAHIGWNRAGSIVNGATSFMNQQGLGNGGWEFINFNNSNQISANCAFLSAVGGLTLGSYSNVTFAPTGGLICPGNVGIGTTSPNALLDVNGSTTQLTLGNTGLSTPNAKKLSFMYQDTSGVTSTYWSTFIGKSLSTNGTNFTYHSDSSNRFMSCIEFGNASLNFYSNLQGSTSTDQTGITPTQLGASRIMTITAVNGQQGRVGIGTASPAALLTCAAAYTNGGTHAEETGAKIILGANNQSGPYGVAIQCRVPANSTVNESDMQFSTCDNSGNQLVRVTIKGTSNPVGGSVGIGTTSPGCLLDFNTQLNINKVISFTGSPATAAATATDFTGFGTSSGNILRYNSQTAAGGGHQWFMGATEAMRLGVVGGNICLGIGKAAGFQLELSTDSARKLTTTTWLTGSDERIKTDIQSANLQTCYDTIKSIDLKYFKWNFPAESNVTVDDNHSLGFIAQDVKKVFPNAVFESNSYGFTDFLSLNTDQILKAMYGALRQTMADKESLEQRLAALEAKLAA
jgi:hypothetical protein